MNALCSQAGIHLRGDAKEDLHEVTRAFPSDTLVHEVFVNLRL